MAVEIDTTACELRMTIDGRTVACNAGETVLESALRAGIHIPHLCHDLRLEKPVGNCGVCVVLLADGRFVKACQTPAREGMTLQTQNEAILAYRRVRIEQLLAQHNADCVAPCSETCPAGIDIQGYLHAVANGDFAAAVRIIKARNPLPLSTGRVCPHPCESACRRGLADAPVAINAIKRFVADHDLWRSDPYVPRKKAPSGKRIAIAGAGPSGLTAAYYAALDGHHVTVFDAQPEAGGMLRYGIPDYRLPQDVLDQEVQFIKDLGVHFVFNRRLGRELRIDNLSRNHDAVYLALGCWRASALGVDGENLPGVWPGIGYLERVAKGERPETGGTVVVVGGGNTAIDCARTALRFGAAVTLLYRRGREEMPAAPYEIEEAEHEGVRLLFLAAPVGIERDAVSGRLTGLACVRMELGEPDRSGRRRPEPVAGSEFSLPATAIVAAIGQKTDLDFLRDDAPIAQNRWGDVEVDPTTLQTSLPNVFAGGDCVTGPATVVQAVAAGRRAAEAMGAYVRTGAIPPARHNYACNRGTLEDLPRDEFVHVPRLKRATMPCLSPSTRATTFEEVETGLDEAAAIAEAQRCLSCGCGARHDCRLRGEATAHGIVHRAPLEHRPRVPECNDHPFILRDHNKCIACGLCVAACAEIAGAGALGFRLEDGAFRVATKDGRPLGGSDCIHCGHCVNACPCGALDYHREIDKVRRAIHEPETLVIGFVAPAVRSVIAAHFNLTPAEGVAFLAGLLKRMGFDRVFDFVIAADLTVMEETHEFLSRLNGAGPLPHLTSCCPAWVNFVENGYPALRPHLSTCKSPQQMMGAVVKSHYAQWAKIKPGTRIFAVSVVPCLAKKHEAARPEFTNGNSPDVDAVLTTNEIIEWVETTHLDVTSVPLAGIDPPYNIVSGGGVLFGASGGVAEAALRVTVAKLSGITTPHRLDFAEVRGADGVRAVEVDVAGRKLRLAVVSGLKNAVPLLDQLARGKDIGYDLVEVMACPGGCVAGAGHPAPAGRNALAERSAVLDAIDRASPTRRSHENPALQRLYTEFFARPGSAKARELLHVHR